jgi:hypothetical protein
MYQVLNGIKIIGNNVELQLLNGEKIIPTIYKRLRVKLLKQMPDIIVVPEPKDRKLHLKSGQQLKSIRNNVATGARANSRTRS